METEVRFYYPLEDEDKLVERLKKCTDLDYAGKFHEITKQYNHPMKEFDFYGKKVDGRLRVRKTEGEGLNKCMISWKQRLGGGGLVHEEREAEVRINASDYENLEYILREVFHLDLMESYERFRSLFSGEGIEVVVDRYPFGVAIEIENKGDNDDALGNVQRWVEKLGFDLKDAYHLSWDDKYRELCEKQGKKVLKEVVFGAEMPRV